MLPSRGKKTPRNNNIRFIVEFTDTPHFGKASVRTDGSK